MVEIVSGSGIARILSYNEVQEDRVARENAARAALARDGRIDVREAGLARALEAEALAGAATREAPADGVAGDDTSTRSPRFADLVSDPETVNRALEDTQGVDRQISEGERLRQAASLADSFLRNYFISLIDPGRAISTISPRDLVRPTEDDFQ
jgi:hypothetical protein